MKIFLKKMREKSFKKPSATELVLLVAIVLMIFFKFIPNQKRESFSFPDARGDYGPSPYSKHLESSQPWEPR